MSLHVNIHPRQRQRFMRYLLVLVLVAVTPPCHAGAADHNSTTRALKILAPHYPPYSSDQGGGVLVEIIAAAFNSVGIKASFEVVPIRRGERMLAAGEADGFIGGKLFSGDQPLASITSEPILYVLPTFFSFAVPLSPSDTPFDGTRLQGYKIGSIFNSPYRSIYETSGLDVTYLSDPERLIRMAAKSRLDIFGSSLISGLLLTKSSNAALIERMHYSTWGRTPMGLAVIEGDAGSELLNRFHRGLELIQQDGAYMAIMAAYWGENNIPAQVLPDSMERYGTEAFDLKRFLAFDRDHQGRIIAPR